MTQRYAKDCRSTIIPALRYQDAPKAIEWLINALGFTQHSLHQDSDGNVLHAELTFGNGMIMLGSASLKSDWSRLTAQPAEIGMRSTVTTCLIASDASALYQSAKAAGAEIMQELAEMPYGGKAFGCRDPEGHLWSIGEYDPWAAT